MAPVGGGEVVGRQQMGANPGGHSFLTSGQVQRPAHLRPAIGSFAISADTALAGDFSGIFKSPDAHHASVQIGQGLGGYGHRFAWVGLKNWRDCRKAWRWHRLWLTSRAL